MKEMIFRFLVGGAGVCCFAALGDIFKPKELCRTAGCAVGSSGHTLAYFVERRKNYAQIEARSMILGALAFFLYAWLVAWLLVRNEAVRRKFFVLAVASSSLVLWFAGALGFFYIAFR